MQTTTAPSSHPNDAHPASSLMRMGVAGALLGAAAIHFAYAPAHLGAETSRGLFFVVVAWLQLGAAVMIGLGSVSPGANKRRVPSKLALLGTAAFNAGIIGVWVVSRTAGIGGHEEAMAFPDVAATVLEGLVIAGCVALVVGTFAHRAVPAMASGGLMGALVVALIALVSASLVPELSGGHSSGGHGGDEAAAGGTASADHHGDASGQGDGHGAEGTAAAAGGEHHGEGGAAGPSQMSPEEFAEYRIQTLTGNLPVEQLAVRRDQSVQMLSNIIRTRSKDLQALPEAEQERRLDEYVNWTVNNALTAEHQSGGDPSASGNHAHGVTEWQWMEDPAERNLLEDQLKTAATVVDRFPTAADAMKAGYAQVTNYVPGIGAHYINIGLILSSGFDPANPEMLLYNGEMPESELVGVSYALFAKEAPEGFAGPNDSWHIHPALCMVGLFVVGPDSTPDELCRSIGGSKGTPSPGGGSLQMMHLWQVPGWESPWGLFSGENPNLNLATADPIPPHLATPAPTS